MINVCLESIPDLTPLLKPTTFGDIVTYFLASAGGLFLGGELGKSLFRCYVMSSFSGICADLWFVFCLGLVGGAASGTRKFSEDPESKKRIETAFRRFRADVLRKQADALDKGSDSGLID